jgi:hypothetical protein
MPTYELVYRGTRPERLLKQDGDQLYSLDREGQWSRVDTFLYLGASEVPFTVEEVNEDLAAAWAATVGVVL